MQLSKKKSPKYSQYWKNKSVATYLLYTQKCSVVIITIYSLFHHAHYIWKPYTKHSGISDPPWYVMTGKYTKHLIHMRRDSLKSHRKPQKLTLHSWSNLNPFESSLPKTGLWFAFLTGGYAELLPGFKDQEQKLKDMATVLNVKWN